MPGPDPRQHADVRDSALFESHSEFCALCTGPHRAATRFSRRRPARRALSHVGLRCGLTEGPRYRARHSHTTAAGFFVDYSLLWYNQANSAAAVHSSTREILFSCKKYRGSVHMCDTMMMLSSSCVSCWISTAPAAPRHNEQQTKEKIRVAGWCAKGGKIPYSSSPHCLEPAEEGRRLPGRWTQKG